jgi:hypothetical protein
MYSGKGAEAGVEDKALLVSRRSRRPDDQSGYAAVLGATDGRPDSIGKVDHAPLVTAPELVVEMILEGVTSLTARPNM